MRPMECIRAIGYVINGIEAIVSNDIEAIVINGIEAIVSNDIEAIVSNGIEAMSLISSS